MPFVTLERAQLWYAEAGNGAPVILVHGGLLEPMDGKLFWVEPGVAGELEDAGFRVLIPDRRFSGGQTVAPVDIHTWDTEAHDLLSVLRAAGVKRAHVVAGSNGVSTAIRFAFLYPSHVLSLNLCWPSPPENRPVHAIFEHARSVIAQTGPAGYVDTVRGIHGATADRPMLYQHVLAPDSPVATTFAQLTANEAERLISQTERRLLDGEVLRGVSTDDLVRLGEARIPISIVPADPEDRTHTRAIAETLAGQTAGARLATGTPPSPSPAFPPYRDAFVRLLTERLRSTSG